MKTLFEAADRYIASSDWKLIAVLKFCLISLGMVIGMLIKPERKKGVMIGALCVFLSSPAAVQMTGDVLRHDGGIMTVGLTF